MSGRESLFRHGRLRRWLFEETEFQRAIRTKREASWSGRPSEVTLYRQTLEEIHSAVSLAHFELGQAVRMIEGGAYANACVAVKNADKFVSVIGRRVTPDLEAPDA